MSARHPLEVEVEGRRLELSNLDKVFYPATGFTKGQVIDYYIRIAPALLPHLRDRPLTLKRYPNGVAGPFFYEKRCPGHRPPWIRTEAVWSRANEDVIHFCVVDDLPSLVWAVNLADLEMHTYLHRVPHVDRPTMVVFDLDPGPPADAVQCCEVALLLRRLFDRLGLAAFPKTSGSKGVQVYVPLNTPVDYQATKAFAKAVAEVLEGERPDLVVSSMKKALRAGKVLVDWSQNDVHKTTVCAWSLRARERPTVSAPVRWEELERGLRARDAGRLAFEAPVALARFERDGDLMGPVLTLEQRLPGVEGVASAGAPRRRGAARDDRSGAAPPPGRGSSTRLPKQAKPGARGGATQAAGARPGAGRPAPAAPPRAADRRRPRRGAGRAARDGYLSTE